MKSILENLEMDHSIELKLRELFLKQCSVFIFLLFLNGYPLALFFVVERAFFSCLLKTYLGMGMRGEVADILSSFLPLFFKRTYRCRLFMVFFVCIAYIDGTCTTIQDGNFSPKYAVFFYQ